MIGDGRRNPGLPAGGKERREQRGTSRLLDPADNLRAMVAGRLLEDARSMIDAASLGIVSAEGQPAQARE